MSKLKHHLEIKSRMKEKGIDKKQLERETKISEWKLQKILEGKIVPNKEELKCIYDALDMNGLATKERNINTMRLSEILSVSMKEKKLNYDTAASAADVDQQSVRNMIEASGIYLPLSSMKQLAAVLEIKELEEIKHEECSDLLGRKIRGYRAINGFTIEKLSELTKIHAGQLDMYEAGYKLPDEEVQKKLAEAFEISIEELKEDKIPCFDREKYPTFASQLKVAKEAYRLQIGTICFYVNAGWNTVTGFENGTKNPTGNAIIEKFNKLFNCEFINIEESSKEEVEETTEEIIEEKVERTTEEVEGAIKEKQTPTCKELWRNDLNKEEKKLYGKQIGSRVRELRKMQNKSKKDLAKAIGYNVHIIECLESGKHVPNIELMAKIAAYFRISINDVCNDNVVKQKSSLPNTTPVIENEQMVGEPIVNEEFLIKEEKVIEEESIIKDAQTPEGELITELTPETETIKENESLEEDVSLKTKEATSENTEKVTPPDSQILANMYNMLTNDGKRKLMNALWDVFEDEANRLPQYRKF